MTPKSIFEYDNYREYLRDFYAGAKAEKGKFSFRYFSRVAGFKSPNFLKRVMDGESKLSRKSIEKFALALKLNKEETHFFRHLVLLNQAESITAKHIHSREILKSRSYRKIHSLTRAQYDYFTHWYFVAIRELIGLSTFNEDPAWIAKQLRPQISVDEASNALASLSELGLITRNESGRLVQATPNIGTPDEVLSAALAQGHRQIIKLAAEAIERFPREKRDISAVTFPSSPETTKKIKLLVQDFRKKILEVASEDPGPNSVYQLNFQIFPIVECADEETTK